MKADGSWRPCKHPYLFHVKALSLTFRGKFIDHMIKAYQAGTLKFPGISAPFQRPDRFNQLKKSLYSKTWVVHMNQTINRPGYVLDYLGRYTHQGAISNHRIVSV